MSSITFIVVTGAAAILIVGFVVQWLKIQELLHEKSLITPHSNSHLPFADLVFTDSPFPLCIVDDKNTILWATSIFWKLVRVDKTHTLADIDRQLGSSLSNLAKEGIVTSHFKLSVRGNDPEDSLKRRIFTTMSWPYTQKKVKGRVLCFFEQTNSHQHYHSNASFEHQLVRCIAELSSELTEVTGTERKTSDDTLLKWAEEAQSVALYLQDAHHQLRKQSPHEPVNLSNICKDVFSEERKIFQSQKIHTITTLPHHCMVYGTQEEIHQCLTLVVEGVKELAERNQDLRVDVKSEKRHVLLSFHLPGVIIPEEWVHHLSNFGRKQGPLDRLMRLKLALAQQIAVKYNGNLAIASNEQDGTRVELSFVNADTK